MHILVAASDVAHLDNPQSASRAAIKRAHPAGACAHLSARVQRFSALSQPERGMPRENRLQQQPCVYARFLTDTTYLYYITYTYRSVAIDHPLGGISVCTCIRSLHLRVPHQPDARISRAFIIYAAAAGVVRIYTCGFID